jgi:hypothetical protein
MKLSSLSSSLYKY